MYRSRDLQDVKMLKDQEREQEQEQIKRERVISWRFLSWIRRDRNRRNWYISWSSIIQWRGAGVCFKDRGLDDCGQMVKRSWFFTFENEYLWEVHESRKLWKRHCSSYSRWVNFSFPILISKVDTERAHSHDLFPGWPENQKMQKSQPTFSLLCSFDINPIFSPFSFLIKISGTIETTLLRNTDTSLTKKLAEELVYDNTSQQ